jgi:enoyl-CoA hydratase/carnithine racemase
MDHHVIFAVEDRVARIELARPEKKNALTPGMYAALARALAAAEADGAVRAVLIHGAPGCFCAGNDLADFLSGPAGGELPEAASTLLLPMIAGYQRAAELLLLGQPFGVEKASAAGFVTEVVAEAEVIERARAAARAVAALPPEAVRLTKGLMRGPLAAGVAAQMAEELRLFSLRVTSPEAREALGAFFEKRKPDFSAF